MISIFKVLKNSLLWRSSGVKALAVGKDLPLKGEGAMDMKLAIHACDLFQKIALRAEQNQRGLTAPSWALAAALISAACHLATLSTGVMPTRCNALNSSCSCASLGWVAKP